MYINEGDGDSTHSNVFDEAFVQAVQPDVLSFDFCACRLLSLLLALLLSHPGPRMPPECRCPNHLLSP